MVKEAVKIGMTLRAALAFSELYDDIEDNGTSNMDSCVVEFDSINKTFIEIINEICGGCLSKHRKNSYLVQIKCNGQGFKRTKKAEVVCEYLNMKGIKSRVEYNID